MAKKKKMSCPTKKKNKQRGKKKVCPVCKGYGVYNGCVECGKVSDPVFGHD